MNPFELRMHCLSMAKDLARTWPATSAEEVVKMAERFEKFATGEPQPTTKPKATKRR